MLNRYQGYEAWDYLGEEKPTINVSCGDCRVPEFLIPLTSEEVVRLEKIRRDNIFIGLHDHYDLLPDDIFQDMALYMKNGRRGIGYAQIARGAYDVIFEGVGGVLTRVSSSTGGKWDDCIYDIGMRSCDVAHQDYLVKCLSVEDIRKAKEDGRVGWVIGLEDAQSIENEIDRLDILYGLGVRVMGLTYSSSNYTGSGGQDRTDSGLSNFGIRVVERMNKLGILIDCAHSSEKSIIDVTEVSSAPIILSHIGARALWDTRRMATDECLVAVAAKGGVIGIECAPHTTMTSKTEEHTFYSAITHFEYVRDLVGIDHVMFGGDTLYGDHVKLHQFTKGTIKAEHKSGAVSVPYVKGAENPTEMSKNILRYLVCSNYSDNDIAKVMGGNLLRVLDQAWI